jgi:hypothetical protein
MAMVVAVSQAEGTLLPELVQWLPTSALGVPIGTTGPAALTEATSIVTAGPQMRVLAQPCGHIVDERFERIREVFCAKRSPCLPRRAVKPTRTADASWPGLLCLS